MTSIINRNRPAWLVGWLGFFMAGLVVCAQAPGQKIEVQILDVGQADAILIRCPDGQHHMLIDAGDTKYPGSAKALQAALEKELQGRPQRIEAVVATHPHSDHIGSMYWVLNTFTVGTYADNGQRVNTATYGRLDALRQKLSKAGRLVYVNGKEHAFGEITFCPLVKTLLIEPWAKGDLSDTNAKSVAVRVEYGKKVFIFAGDLEESAEKLMVNKFTEQERRQLDADVLKVGHHGSDTSSTVPFIQAVSPELAVISCGAKDTGTNKRYRHPRLSTVRNYTDWFREHLPLLHPPHDRVWAYNGSQWVRESRPDGTWFTPNDGTVTIRSDGESLEVVTGNH